MDVGRGRSSGEANGARPVKILKTESTFSKGAGPRSVSSTTKKLVFADEKGASIAENVFVEQLHYSSNTYPTAEASKACCVIS